MAARASSSVAARLSVQMNRDFLITIAWAPGAAMVRGWCCVTSVHLAGPKQRCARSPRSRLGEEFRHWQAEARQHALAIEMVACAQHGDKPAFEIDGHRSLLQVRPP